MATHCKEARFSVSFERLGIGSKRCPTHVLKLKPCLREKDLGISFHACHSPPSIFFLHQVANPALEEGLSSYGGHQIMEAITDTVENVAHRLIKAGCDPNALDGKKHLDHLFT